MSLPDSPIPAHAVQAQRRDHGGLDEAPWTGASSMPAMEGRRLLLTAAAVCSVITLVAVVLYRLAAQSDAPPEQLGMRMALVLAAAGGIALAGSLALWRGRASASELGVLVVSLAIGAFAVLAMLHLVGQVLFPADILIWSESDFVNDILKLRLGVPLYGPQADNSSFVYMPGAQTLTWVLASLAGAGHSVVGYRAVQLGFTLAAVGVGLLTIRRLLQVSGVVPGPRATMLWTAVWTPALLLFATNQLTNPFAVLLHNDALNQLLHAIAFWLLVEYTVTRRRLALAGLVVLPAIGFLVKQSFVLWIVLTPAGLLLTAAPEHRVRDALRVALTSAALVLVAFGAGYALWRDDFIYWVFTVLAKHGVSPLRSMQHALDAGAYFAGGLVAGLVLLRGPARRTLAGPWLVWLALLGSQAYTSGIAYMHNHMGPGSLLAGVWVLAAVTLLWTRLLDARATPATGEARIVAYAEAAVAAGVALFLLPMFGVVRMPEPPFHRDAYRYVADIEREFTDRPAERVLLDAGTWVYQGPGVVQRDRAPTIGERGFSSTGDFSQVIGRIREHRYDRILLRQYGQPAFWYDNADWNASSGIAAALQQHYRVVRVIPGVQRTGETRRYLFEDVSVLEPVPTGTSGGGAP